MRKHHGKRPGTQIFLQDACAEDMPLADDAAERGDYQGVDDQSAPKPPQKQANLAQRAHAHQHIENDDAMAAAHWETKSPWDMYQPLFDLQLGDVDYFTIAEQKIPDVVRNPVVIMKTFTGPTAETHIQAIRRIQNDRFVDPQLFFHIESGYLVSFEFMPLALCEIAGNPLLNDLRMASALGQVSYVST